MTSTTIGAAGATSIELARATGVSYRRIDYWVRCGYLCPRGNPTPGSGGQRAFDANEVAVVRLLAVIAPLVNNRGRHGSTVTPASAMELCAVARSGERPVVEVAIGVYVDLERICGPMPS